MMDLDRDCIRRAHFRVTKIIGTPTRMEVLDLPIPIGNSWSRVFAAASARLKIVHENDVSVQVRLPVRVVTQTQE